jgi:F-type H+-transporting ATPase subunit epsilon
VPESFACSLVTPERSVIDTEAKYVDLPAHDGQIGVMNNRAPLLVKLGVGRLRLELPEGGEKRFAIDGGFAQMKGNKLTLVSEKAVAAEDVTRDEARARLEEARGLPTKTTEQVDQRIRDVAFAETLVKLAEE